MYTVLSVQDIIEDIRNKVEVWAFDSYSKSYISGIPLSLHVTEELVKVNLKTENGYRDYDLGLIGLSEEHAKVLHLSRCISHISEEIKSLSIQKKELSLQLIDIYADEMEGE